MKTLKLNKMKDYLRPIIYILTICLLSLILGSCNDVCTDSRVYNYYEPVYMSLEDLRSSVETTTEQREIVNPGAIYYLDGHILINQPNEGIHVIDNTDKSNPQYVSFVEIPGNFSLAGKGDRIYADSYVDLVILDFSNKTSIKELGRMENIFPNYNSMGFYVDSEKGVVSDWKEVEATYEFDNGCDGADIYNNWFFFNGGVAVDFMALESGAVSQPQVGIGGSLAKFTISGDHLYTVDQESLTTVDISSADNPVASHNMNIGWGLETIFPYGELLFLGANNGMHIIDISNPAVPDHLSTYAHILSCDPVVVQGDYAFVTLRDGDLCRNGINQLEVVNVADPTNPQQVSAFPMFNPGGLGVDNNLLFVCDGDAGLKIFDKTDLQNITSNLIKAYTDIKAIDVIPYSQTLMVIAEDGFYQYDYSELQNLEYLSKININR